MQMGGRGLTHADITKSRRSVASSTWEPRRAGAGRLGFLGLGTVSAGKEDSPIALHTTTARTRKRCSLGLRIEPRRTQRATAIPPCREHEAD